MHRLIVLFWVLFILHPVVGQQDGYAPSENVKIHYRCFGDGEPLLIINGGPGMSSEGFVPLAQTLAETHRTIIYDQRGTGLSTVESLDSTNINMRLMLHDIEALRTHLKIDSWIVMGHSFGGMLASYYASKYPERVGALILSSSGGIDLELLSYINITSKLSQAEQDSLSFWNSRIQNGDTTYFARLQRGKFLAPAYLFNRKYIPIVAERLTQGNSTVNSLIWADMNKIKFNCAEGLGKFDKPALIIQGKQDLINEKTARKAEELLSVSRVVILNECGHYGWLDQREMYFQEINSFLNDIGPN